MQNILDEFKNEIEKNDFFKRWIANNIATPKSN